MIRATVRAALVLLLSAGSLSAQMIGEPEHQWSMDRPDGTPPAGVFDVWSHPAGTVTLSYNLLYQNFDVLRVGSDSIGVEEVLDRGFRFAPWSRTNLVHRASLQWRPVERVQITASGSFVDRSMDQLFEDGFIYETQSSGIGDVEGAISFRVLDESGWRVYLTAGASAPTGSIDEEDETPESTPGDEILPYSMQTGSGTFDLRPAAHLSVQNPVGTVGMDLQGVIRLGENDEDYTLGDRFEGSLWMAYRFNDVVSASLRLQAQWWKPIENFDARLDPDQSPATDEFLTGGRRVDFPIGINFLIPGGTLEGQRLRLEFGFPIHRDLDGPQLDEDWFFTAGWQANLF